MAKGRGGKTPLVRLVTSNGSFLRKLAVMRLSAVEEANLVARRTRGELWPPRAVESAGLT